MYAVGRRALLPTPWLLRECPLFSHQSAFHIWTGTRGLKSQARFQYPNKMGNSPGLDLKAASLVFMYLARQREL